MCIGTQKEGEGEVAVAKYRTIIEEIKT